MNSFGLKRVKYIIMSVNYQKKCILFYFWDLTFDYFRNEIFIQTLSYE